jgi:hypothetical protein
MQDKDTLAAVRSWQDAANDRDLERLLGLSDPNIELIGPRGIGRGHRLLRDWLDRAGASFETQRVFARGDTAVLAQRGVWRSYGTGEVIGESDVVSRFRVEGGRVAQLARYDNLEAALEEAGLNLSDERTLYS